MASADATAATNTDDATNAAKQCTSIFIRQNDTMSSDCSKCTGHTILYAYSSSMNAPFSNNDLCKLYWDTNTFATIVLYKRRTAKPGCTSGDTRWFITGTQRYSFNNQPRRCESVTQYNVSYEFLFNLMEKIPSVDGLGTPLNEKTLRDLSSSYQPSDNQLRGILDNASMCDCYAKCVSCLCNHDGHECVCECECVCDGDCDGKCACECKCHGACDDCADDCYLNY